MSRSGRYGWLKTVGIAIAVLAVLAGVCMAVSTLLTVRMVHSTEPYQHAVELALQSPEVKQALGEPVRVGRLAQGTVNLSPGGDALLWVPLHGSLQSASMRVNATNRAGEWQYFAIRVDTDDGERIDLLER